MKKLLIIGILAFLSSCEVEPAPIFKVVDFSGDFIATKDCLSLITVGTSDSIAVIITAIPEIANNYVLEFTDNYTLNGIAQSTYGLTIDEQETVLSNTNQLISGSIFYYEPEDEFMMSLKTETENNVIRCNFDLIRQ